MFCNKCGNEILDNVNFCNKCGAKMDTSEGSSSVNSTTEKTQKRKKSIRKIALIIGIILVGIFWIMSGSDDKPIVAIPMQLAQEYVRDSVVAEKKWKNKKVEIFGQVLAKGQFSDSKRTYIGLRSDYPKFAIVASFDAKDSSKWSDIEELDVVKVVGKCLGYMKQKNGTTSAEIEVESIRKLSKEEVKKEAESFMQRELKNIPPQEMEEINYFFRLMLTGLDTSNDSSKKSSESPKQAAAKSDRQIAQELIYGKWADVETGIVKYQFNRNNVQILDDSDVDPYGDSLIRVKRKDIGAPYTNCFISVEGNKYYLGMDNMRENGTAIRDDDHMTKYVKTY